MIIIAVDDEAFALKSLNENDKVLKKVNKNINNNPEQALTEKSGLFYCPLKGG